MAFFNNLFKSERSRFKLVIDGLVDGIIILSPKREIMYFNKAAQRITGLSEKDAIGKNCDEALIFFKHKTRLSASEFCPISPSDKDRVILVEKEVKLVTAKKELFVALTSTSLKGGEPSDIGCILTLRDSSKEREAEEMKLDFVSMAAHELRAPLTAIKGYLSVLEPTIKQKLTDEEMKYIGRVLISSNELAMLVENLLDVSKIEHNLLKIEVRPEVWVDIIKEVVENYKELAKQKGISLKFLLPKNPLPPVAADKFRVSEVLSNLISNALSHTEAGGTVEITAVEKDGAVETSVKDTGVGIPEKALPHLFTKFYRVSGALEQGSKGTGLGLFICKSIVNMHHGDIWAQSKLGEGSVFTFTIPVYTGKEDEPKSINRKL